MVNLLKGDLLATTGTGLTVLTAVFGAVAVVLFAFRKEFLLVSFDRDLAIVFGKRAGVWDALLYFLSGVTISFGVMTAGPIVTFGFLVIPPLTARLVTRHMIAFSLASAAIGAATAFAGFYCAYRFDLPLGPAEVALASLVLAVDRRGELASEIVRSLLWLCFTLSGAAALGLELLWLRSAALVVGATAETAASVLASYFAGLALGGLFAREAPAQPIRRYGFLELSAAAAALWSYAVFSAATSASAERLLDAGGMTARVALVSLAIVPATFFLGATLPTLGHALATPETVGCRGGLLYSLNTLGGVVGIAAMGFGLPLWIGVRASYLLAAATSAIAGGLALWVGDGGVRATPATAPHAAPPLRLCAVAAGAGFVAIGLEVLWVKLFAQVLHNSVYSFAAVSLVFLLAIAVGAAIGSAALSRFAAPAVAATGLVLAALTAVLGVWSFVRWTDGLRYFGMETGLPEYVARIIGIAAATAGPAAIASGGVLPALWAAAGDRESVARPIGELTAANLTGAVLGALVTAFVAIPTIGIRPTFLLAAVAYVALADAVAGSRSVLRPFGYAALLGDRSPSTRCVSRSRIWRPARRFAPAWREPPESSRSSTQATISSFASTTTTCSGAAPQSETSAGRGSSRCFFTPHRAAWRSSAWPPGSARALRPRSVFPRRP